MSEYDLYTSILAPRFLCENQTLLSEKTEKGKHEARIITQRIDYSIYRYDQTEHGDLFLPFFNNTHDGERGKAAVPAPSDLLKFCDYIILAEQNNALYVLLIEMKSGSTGDANRQLDASYLFMEYIKSTAQRISKANGYERFNVTNIKTRKIVLKQVSNRDRPMTNIAKSNRGNIDLRDPIIYFTSETLPLRLFCREM